MTIPPKMSIVFLVYKCFSMSTTRSVWGFRGVGEFLDNSLSCGNGQNFLLPKIAGDFIIIIFLLFVGCISPLSRGVNRILFLCQKDLGRYFLCVTFPKSTEAVHFWCSRSRAVEQRIDRRAWFVVRNYIVILLI